MTATIPDHARPAGAVAQSGTGLRVRPGLAVALGLLLSLLLSWPRAVDIWQTGAFFDTDDAMRMVQVRDWLAGQGWYDLVAHRLNPPQGLLMHWSRLVDLPLAALLRAFELVTDPGTAERLMRITFPLLLQGVMVVVTAATAELLSGAAAVLPATILLALSGYEFEQFPPGRIDHHAPQIVLLMAMTGTILAALGDAGRARLAAVTGLCAAVSLAISLENLPFILVLMAALPVAWLLHPHHGRAALIWLAAGLAVSGPLLFAVTVPWARAGLAEPDAFSLPHLVAMLLGAAGLVALAEVSRFGPSLAIRGVGLLLAGAAVVGPIAILFPACLHGPYAAMDPLLRHLWLDNVTEAQPLLATFRARPAVACMLGGPIMAGTLAAALAVARTRGVVRTRWAVLLALILVGLLGTLWEVRVATSTQPLAVLAGAWVVMTTARTFPSHSTGIRSAAACASALPFATLAWVLVPTGTGDAAMAAALARAQACRASPALAPLATLPPGLVFAPIDDGSHLLAATPHAVLAAPYHRNEAANRLVLEGFMAPPDRAEAVVRGTGATYVMICPGEVQIATVSRAAPDGLGAALSAGHAPSWLIPLPLEGTPYRVFTLRSPRTPG